jgi:hypothetical protein
MADTVIELGQALKDRYTLERDARSRNIQNWLLPSAIFDRVRDATEFHQSIDRMDQWHRTEFDLARWRQPRPQD